MIIRIILIAATSVISFTGCVSKKKYMTQVNRNKVLDDSLLTVIHRLDMCLDEKDKDKKRITGLEQEVERLKREGGALISQLTDLSVINKNQAESIRQSLENINSKEIYIRGLQNALSRKDSLNLALVMNIKSSLRDINDQDVEVKVDGSAVFVSISEKMLFETGSYEVSRQAGGVLEKVARILSSRPDLKIMVEGHTDSIAINNHRIADNWELSVLRATAVTRVLTAKHGIDASRIIAAGRGHHDPVASNATEEGRRKNRRIRIIILPELDQFMKLLETKP